jgi:signal transduction histidine kinase
VIVVNPRLEPDRADGRLARDPWRTWIPFFAVVIALVALVALPIMRARYVEPIRDDLRLVAEPSRSLLTRIHVALAMEGVLLRDYEESGDSLVVRRYHAAAADEQRAYDELEPLVSRLGPTVKRDFSELRELESEWHKTVEERIKAPNSLARIPTGRRARLYEELLLSAGRLDEAVNASAQRRWVEIDAANNALEWVTLLIGLLAFAATLIVAWLVRRVRVFAVEAERRRGELQLSLESRARLMRGITHDLKNPLHSIAGHAELLADGFKGPLSDDQQDSVSRIKNSVDSLLSLINDLLELSRTEGGRLAIRAREMDISDVMRRVVSEHAAAARMAGHRLDVELPEQIPPISTDSDRVEQVLGNLLSNAIKYTPSGGRIIVRAERRARYRARGDDSWTALEVIDNGSGIPEDRVDAIFDEFSRLDAHRDIPGAGVGLAIARRIARLLGGDINVTPAVGGGSTFTLWLPDHLPGDRSR